MAKRGELQHERGVVRFWSASGGVICRDNSGACRRWAAAEVLAGRIPVVVKDGLPATCTLATVREAGPGASSVAMA